MDPQKFSKIRYNSVLSYLSFLGWFFQGNILKFDKIPCHTKLTLFVKTTSKKTRHVIQFFQPRFNDFWPKIVKDIF